MFKRFRGLCVFLLVCAVLFTSCRAKAPDDGNSSPGGSAQPGGEPTWRLVTPSRGFSLYSGNGQGAYHVENTGKDFSGHLVYHDYGTMQEIYLSPQLDVTFDEQNPGWIADTSGGVFPIATDDALYVFIYGLNSSEHPARLLRMNPDASDRKEITLTGGYSVELYSAVASYGGELYFIAQKYRGDTGEIESVALVRSDFKNGELVEVRGLDSGTDTFLVGVCEDGMILQKSTDTDSEYGFSIVDETGAETALPLRWDAHSQTKAVCDGKIVLCENEAGRVSVFDIATGETNEVLDLETYGAYIAEEPWDGHVILDVYETAEGGEMSEDPVQIQVVKRLYVDLETGETGTLTLTRPTVQLGDVYIRIFLETEHDFLVEYQTHSEEQVAYAPGGSEYMHKVTVSDLALIAKDDFWNSVPNYRPFADAR